jgi:gluconokinase
MPSEYSLKIKFYILIGVSGSGKTTVGKALAANLGWDFYDADDFHPPENIAKMASGIPLNDDDRAPWLASLHALIASCLKGNQPGVLACSALKDHYRQMLLEGNPCVEIVYLKGDYDFIWRRMLTRPGHYMKPEMLHSQFEALDEPTNGLVMDASLSVDEIVNKILENSTMVELELDCGKDLQ